jgi:glutaredoxin
MDESGYDYEMIDIDEDLAARERCVALAGKVITPTFEIGETCIVDFDPAALTKALGEPSPR